MYGFLVRRAMGARNPQKALTWFSSFNLSRSVHSLPFATVEVEKISGSQPAEVHNLVQGKWAGSSNWNTIVDPLNGEPFIKVADVDEKGVQCPKHGLHNPFKAPERYLLFGDISAKAAHMLSIPERISLVIRFVSWQGLFSSWKSSRTAKSWLSLAIWSGGNCHTFQFSLGDSSTSINECYMGNKPTLKKCFVDVDFINSDGRTMNKLLLEANPRMTLFTGSSRVAEKLAVDLKVRIKLEDAGRDYVAWVCDQDAYACSGQKCSAQSMLFMHENWSCTSLISKLKDLAERRKLEHLTIGPVLTVTTESMLEHMNKLLKIPGSKLLFGGEPLENHSIPQIYGAIKPTAIYVPLGEILKANNYELVTREIFGPFQIITDYKGDQLPLVLDALERMHALLTAAVVSNDPSFCRQDLIFSCEVIGNSVNGTTYAGLRARTTGAPQNHWFRPAGDPRGAGIGTPEAIKLVWSCHREIIYDFGPCQSNGRFQHQPEKSYCQQVCCQNSST
ncbi:Delta-1-pyrroline-5-carboxylate dehydrogenase 1 protein [Quillaja saponaria]|uniref:Delta-1-pyrroline-5-carboxylate dehydrogenase 1 protein n=1 Tax=Quillaja saponaria TaxID=32244 RepID=A0AAD7KVR0_QUISA|nr:Delta-1-pyrroline-5-carboxylate dehydrogenase 1 protein [Quillaja saponaria]